MAITVQDLLVKVRSEGIDETAGKLKGMGAVFGGIGPIAAIAGLAVVGAAVGIGVATVKMAGNFQASMTQLVTGANESQKNLGLVSDAILQMAIDTGTTTQQLAAGMFMIESAGWHGKAGLDVLGAAARGAKVGNADLGVVANATTTIMKDFAGTLPTQAVNLLIGTVARGKTHMQDLADSLSHVLPVASAARVHLGDVAGALATMTGEGVPAADSATYLRQMLISMDAPTKGATALLKTLGFSTQDVSSAMQTSLPDAVGMINDALVKKFGAGSAGYMEGVKLVSGGSKQMQGFLDLAGVHAKDFATNAAQLGGIAGTTGTKITGWALVQGDFNQKMDRAREVAETTGIKIGTLLLPAASKLADIFTNQVAPAVGYFVTHIKDFLPLIVPVAAVLGGALAGALVAAAVAAWALVAPMLVMAAPFIAVGVAIGLLVAALIFAYQHWKGFRDAVDLARVVLGQFFGQVGAALAGFAAWWRANWDTIRTILVGAWDMIKGVVMIAWSVVSGIIKVGLDILSGNWAKAWTDIKNMFAGIWDGMKVLLVGTLKYLGDLVLTFVQVVLGLLAKIPGPIGDMARAALKGVQGVKDQLAQLGSDAGQAYAAGLASAQSRVATAAGMLANAAVPRGALGAAGRAYASGGLISEPVIGMGLTTGTRYSIGESGPEFVTPVAALGRGAPTGGGGTDGPVTINILLDSQVIGRAVLRRLPKEVAVYTGIKGL